MTSDAQPTKDKDAKLGVVHKPLVEQLKLLALFVLIGALIYYSRPEMPSFGIGLALVVIGTIIRVWAAGHLTRDQQLTTSGPYQYTRNPFYLGRFLLIIGFALMSGLSNDFSNARNIIVWVIFLGALLIFFCFYMPRKEAREGGRLAKLFGPDYEVWKKNVPSLFPRLTPYKMHPKSWSRELFMGGDARYTGNKELWTTIVVIGLIGLFFWRMGTLEERSDNRTPQTSQNLSTQ